MQNDIATMKALVERLRWRERVLEDGARAEGTIVKTREALREAAIALATAAAEIERMRGGVRVKAIDWRDMTYNGVEEWLGHCALSQSFIVKDEGTGEGDEFRFVVRPFLADRTSFPTVEAAKAAAQADYNARIRSAIQGGEHE